MTSYEYEVIKVILVWLLAAVALTTIAAFFVCLFFEGLDDDEDMEGGL